MFSGTLFHYLLDVHLYIAIERIRTLISLDSGISDIVIIILRNSLCVVAQNLTRRDEKCNAR